MAIVHRNFMAIFTNEAVFPLGFDGIRPFSVAGRRVFVYDIIGTGVLLDMQLCLQCVLQRQ